jgi:outer membrane protein
MRTFLVILFGCVIATTLAQTPTPPTQKIGFADFEYIFSQLPEYKQIDNELRTHSDQLQNQLKAKYQEYQTKLKTYNDMPASTPDAIRKDKEAELTQLQESIQKFQQDAQTSLTKKREDLMDPVYKKVGKAISDVAKENSYSFILSPQMAGAGDILLYSDDQYNISLLVLKKLGVTPTPPTTQATPPTKTN